MPDRLLLDVARSADRIPEAVLRGFFVCAADIAWAFRMGGVRQLERNLMHVFASEMRQSHEPIDNRKLRRRVRRCSRQGMRSYFAYFCEAMTGGARSEQQLRARIRGMGGGFDSIADNARQGASSLIAMGHQGNWDYAGYWAQFEVAPVVTVAERLANAELLRTFVEIRERLGMRILLTGQHDLTDRLRNALQDSTVVVPLLADRDLSRHGIFVHAFDSTIRVARGPAALAYDTGNPLYVVNLYREKLSGQRKKQAGAPYGYVCDISGPVDVHKFREMPRQEALQAISQAWVDLWARGIAAHPQDWHMLQPLFLEDLDRSRLHDVPDGLRSRMDDKSFGQ